MSTPTLRDLREQAVLTQQEVAHQMGVADNSVSHWELGQQRPRVANIRNLARIYGVSPRFIVASLQATDEATEKKAV